MIDFSQRAREPEMLDGGVSAEEMCESLADLRFVNRRLSNSNRLLHTVHAFLDGSPEPRLLDVGCGSADLLERVRRQSRRPLLAVGVDLKLPHLQFAPSTVKTVMSDVRRLPFRPGSFDVVMATHFLHHFDGPELAEILAALFVLARRALVISDLRRARVPYYFGRVAFPVLFRSGVSVSDGLLSIRRGFHTSELATGFREAGIGVRIERNWPYRLLAIAERNGDPIAVA
jgi:2-polyprenyl-3-methyl-5-hydroxy-6-metoxy-1,4-benzoquinol methylase